MDKFSLGKDLDSSDETIKAWFQKLHKAIAQMNIKSIGGLLEPDVFVLGSAAEAVFNGKEEFLTGLQGLFSPLKLNELHVQGSELNFGICNSDHSAWFLDRFEVEYSGDQGLSHTIPIRLTGLLVRKQGWHLSAASWSIPLRDNDYQYQLLAAGKIPPGIAMPDRVSADARPLVEHLQQVMEQPTLMPAHYSPRPDAFTIGSTLDEVFFGQDGKNFVNEIVHLPLTFAMRGGTRSAVSPDGCTAWLAANIDLSGGLTVPYRFFYIWLLEPVGWQIVVSHDAVCIDPFCAGFDYP